MLSTQAKRGKQVLGSCLKVSAALSRSPVLREFRPCVLPVFPAFWQSEADNKSRTDFVCSGWQRISLPADACSMPSGNLREFPYLRSRHKPSPSAHLFGPLQPAPVPLESCAPLESAS